MRSHLSKNFVPLKFFLEERLRRVPEGSLKDCFPDGLGNAFALVGSSADSKKLFYVGVIVEKRGEELMFAYGQMVDNTPPEEHYYKRWGKKVFSFDENRDAYVGPVVLTWSSGVSKVQFFLHCCT